MSEQPQEKRPSLGARPPTLEALVARLKPSTGDSPSSATSASPPAAAAQPGAGRLRMNILASRSNQNQTGVRPESPTPSVDRPETSGSRASSPKPASAAVASSSGDTGDAPSTTEKEPAKESQKAPKGYKNVPSLEAITERIALVRARSLSAATAERDSSLSARAREDSVSNGRDAVPVVIPEVSEPAAEPAVAEGEVASSADGSESKEEEHPLQHTWYGKFSSPN